MPPGQDLDVDPQLEGFQRLDALEAAIAGQHGESFEAPPAGQTRLEQQRGRPDLPDLPNLARLGPQMFVIWKCAWWCRVHLTSHAQLCAQSLSQAGLKDGA